MVSLWNTFLQQESRTGGENGGKWRRESMIQRKVFILENLELNDLTTRRVWMSLFTYIDLKWRRQATCMCILCGYGLKQFNTKRVWMSLFLDGDLKWRRQTTCMCVLCGYGLKQFTTSQCDCTHWITLFNVTVYCTGLCVSLAKCRLCVMDVLCALYRCICIYFFIHV